MNKPDNLSPLRFPETTAAATGGSLLDPADQVIAETLIGLLDDDGYLREELDALCGLVHINKTRLNRILSQLKTLKPAGIFAHDLRECLLLQLMEQHPENELARRLTEHLEALARGGTTSLCRMLHCTADQLNEAITLLRRCDPKPGRSQGAAAAPLVCEVQVEIEDGQFKIALTHSFSELIFNPMPIDDPTVQDYLKQKTAEAKSLLLAIQKRNQTLASITRCDLSESKRVLSARTTVDSLNPPSDRRSARSASLNHFPVAGRQGVGIQRSALSLLCFFLRPSPE